MLTFNKEQYVTIAEIAKRLQIAHGTCKGNIIPLLTACYLPGRKHALYKQSEVEQLSQVRTVEKQVQPLTIVKQDHEVAYIEDSLRKEAL